MNSIYVDFHNTSQDGKVRLNTIGSVRDLNRQELVLKNGLVVRLYSEDFEVTGTVEFANGEHLWVASFNWHDLRPVTTDENRPCVM